MRKGKKLWWKKPDTKGARRREEQLCSFLLWQPNDTVPGSGGSRPRTVWGQMQYSMFLSEIKESKGKGKLKEMRLRSVIPDLHFLNSAWSLKSTDRTLLISKGFDSELKEKEKMCSMVQSSLASQLYGNAQSFAQSYTCLSNVLLPWIAPETYSIQQDPWKDLNYGLIYIYLIENINVLPEDLRVK